MNKNGKLSGKRILVTRSKEQAAPLSKMLEDHGAAVVEFPLIRIEPPNSFDALDEAIRNIKDYQWLVLTSVNGVIAFFSRMHSLCVGMDTLDQIKICAVGKATKEAIEAQNGMVYCVPEEYTTQALLQVLQSKVGKSDNVLLARSDMADKELSLGLRGYCQRVTDVVAYKTVPCDATQMETLIRELPTMEYVIFASRSAVQSLAGSVDKAILQTVGAVCIGPVTYKAAKELPFREVHMAKVYTVEGLLNTILEVSGSEEEL